VENLANQILIIYAHPDTGGNCATILESIKRDLLLKKQKYMVLDLYRENYDPILKEQEHYTRGNQEVSEKTKEYQQLILQSNKLIFIFPIWWGQMPAILKGFCDRVLTPGFAFKFKKLIASIYIPEGLLKNKKCAVFMTYGSPWYFYNLGFVKSPKSILDTLAFSYCGLKTEYFELFSAGKVTEKSKVKINKLVKKGINWLRN
jgi:NAD(P)H dehydrogenase (quinone)